MKYNVIIVFDSNESHVLMCRRTKNPYRGMLNFVGGKIEKGENHLEAAYRELQEETSVSKISISLKHIMDIAYILEDGSIEIYVGRLNGDVPISGTENELLWVDINEDFSNTARFAGCGNIYHMLSYIKAYGAQINADEKVNLNLN